MTEPSFPADQSTFLDSLERGHAPSGSRRRVGVVLAPVVVADEPARKVACHGVAGTPLTLIASAGLPLPVGVRRGLIRSSVSRLTPSYFQERIVNTARKKTVTRKQLIKGLNEDLAREYQAIIAYITYSQVIRGAQYQHIAQELEKHAGEELVHALTIAKQIDYLGGTPTVSAEAVKQSDDPREMLQYDLDNERLTIRHYRRRVIECEALGEFAIAEHLREILRQEQEHLTDLAAALDIDPPDPGMA